MGEEAYDETILAADTGTLVIRGGYGREKIWLGIAKGNDPEAEPEMIIALTPRQQKGLGEAIEMMAAAAVQDMKERLEDATYALEKLSNGAAFNDADAAVSWARGIAVSALEEIGQ